MEARSSISQLPKSKQPTHTWSNAFKRSSLTDRVTLIADAMKDHQQLGARTWHPPRPNRQVVPKPTQ